MPLKHTTRSLCLATTAAARDQWQIGSSTGAFRRTGANSAAIAGFPAEPYCMAVALRESPAAFVPFRRL